MAEGDIKVVSGSYGARELDAEDRNTSSISATLKPGEPVKRGGTGGNFAARIADGNPTTGSDIFLGIVNRESTETATADGKVEVNIVGPMTILFGDATTAGNLSTAADLLGIILDYVAFDVSATSVTTIDENEGDDPNVHGLCIVGGDVARSKLFVTPHVGVCISGTWLGQTQD